MSCLQTHFLFHTIIKQTVINYHIPLEIKGMHQIKQTQLNKSWEKE